MKKLAYGVKCSNSQLSACNCETIEDKFAKHTVLVDHDYLPGIEASKWELDRLFKKAPVHCFGKKSV